MSEQTPGYPYKGVLLNVEATLKTKNELIESLMAKLRERAAPVECHAFENPRYLALERRPVGNDRASFAPRLFVSLDELAAWIAETKRAGVDVVIYAFRDRPGERGYHLLDWLPSDERMPGK